jgi:cytochrome c oxidase subunit II
LLCQGARENYNRNRRMMNKHFPRHLLRSLQVFSVLLLFTLAGQALAVTASAATPQTTITDATNGSNLPIHRIQNIFDPSSAPSETIYNLSLLVLVICSGIFIVVAGLLVYALYKYRRRGSEDDLEEPPQVYGSTAIELAWTVPPILITVVLILVTARTIGEISGPRVAANDEKVTIIGHRFWWEVRYPRYHIVTANEIHVPVDSKESPEGTELTLQSADVGHGFWVPRLAGKSWLVPNQTNQLFIKPYQTGIYLGNCTVLCGDQHANMLIRVVVQSREDYNNWLESQIKAVPTYPEVAEGKKQLISNSCGTCHRIEGTAANGTFGPDLSHFMDRQTLGAGVAANTETNLRNWLKDPQTMKPGCLMPNMKLDEKQVDQIVAYLRTLK